MTGTYRSIASSPTREAVYRAYLGRSSIVRGGFVSANWTEDGALWYATGAPTDTEIHRVDLETGETEPMFDVAKVRAALHEATGCEPPYLGLPSETLEFESSGRRWRLDRCEGGKASSDSKIKVSQKNYLLARTHLLRCPPRKSKMRMRG